LTGSPNFEEGDFVETTSISGGKIENGSTVTTATGSRYFLSAEKPTKVAPSIAKAYGSSPTITLTNQRKAIEAKGESEAPPKSTFSLFGLFGGGDDSASEQKTPSSPTKPVAKPNPAPVKKTPTLTIPKTQLSKPKAFGAAPAKKAPPAKKAAQAKKPAPARKTAPAAKAPPKGVAALSGWRANADGSVIGSISGSPNFRDGERVTTSPIIKGRYAKGEVVTTGSGSRYFLS
jgi:hypothetical protein